MKTMMLVFLMLAGVARAQSNQGFAFYGSPQMKWTLPANNLHMQDNPSRVANITEQRFNQIVDEVMSIWIPVAAQKGINLTATKRWSDPTVNASASQSGKTWLVTMYGGLARRPEVTEDGFALVVCHELGHHFGGYSFYGRTDWASAEGESDYFATNACAKYLWGKDMQRNSLYKRLRQTPPIVQQACDAVWNGNANAQAWCVRTALGGHSLATLLSAIGGRRAAPSFETPDKTVVNKTSVSHPQAQCRLDTYFAGALCVSKWDINTIPGKAHPKGQDSPDAEKEAMKYSCFAATGAKVGYRPACWFKGLNSAFNVNYR
ncbi:MAG: hypothetical protein JNL11_05965 [Bdellovibrionaceae bacterium]|nr:hypothetical protein [Pseudobdellovibrionaceae bacterium]